MQQVLEAQAQQVEAKMTGVQKEMASQMQKMEDALQDTAATVSEQIGYIAVKQGYIEERSCYDHDYTAIMKRQLKEQEVKCRVNMKYMNWSMKLEVEVLIVQFLDSKDHAPNYGNYFLKWGYSG